MRTILMMFVAASAIVADGRAAPRNEAIVPPFEAPPEVDGIIAPGEWDSAFQGIGFQGIQPPHLVDPRPGKAWFGYTSDRLYVAVATDLPPDGKLIATAAAAEGDFRQDDAVEIWLDPNRDVRDHVDGPRDIYQLVANSGGATLSRRLLPGRDILKVVGFADAEWKGGWTVAQKVDAKGGQWVVEASLPWTDLGWTPEEVFGRSIGVLIARNFQRPAAQRTWCRIGGSFANAMDYPRLILRRDAPHARIEELGKPLADGRLELKIRLANPGDADTATVWTSASGPGSLRLNDRKDVELAAANEAIYSLDIGPDRLGQKGPYEVKLTIRVDGDELTLLTWSVCWTPTTGNGWDVR